MKLINLYLGVFVGFLGFLSVSYVGVATGNDRVIGEQHTIKINGVCFRQDAAESFLLRANSIYSTISAYDNVLKKNVILAPYGLDRDMDVTVEQNALMSVISGMYQNYNDGYISVESDIVACISRDLDSEKSNKLPIKEIQICVNKKDNKVISVVIYPKSLKSAN